LSILGLLICTSQARGQTLPKFGHVAVVLLENTGFGSSVGSMPYLDSLVAKYGLATNYYADTHPSIGNYFTLTTGQILTNDDSATPSSFPISQANIASLLQAAGKTWKDYPETSGTYYVRHDPLQYMTNINKANLSNFTQFKTDLANHALPNFSWITPNACDSAHDCDLSTADSWLQTNIDPLVKSTYFQPGGDGLLIIVFDENGGSGGTNSTGTTAGGQVECVIVSPNYRFGGLPVDHPALPRERAAADGARTGADVVCGFFRQRQQHVGVLRRRHPAGRRKPVAHGSALRERAGGRDQRGSNGHAA